MSANVFKKISQSQDSDLLFEDSYGGDTSLSESGNLLVKTLKVNGVSVNPSSYPSIGSISTTNGVLFKKADGLLYNSAGLEYDSSAAVLTATNVESSGLTLTNMTANTIPLTDASKKLVDSMITQDTGNVNIKSSGDTSTPLSVEGSGNTNKIFKVSEDSSGHGELEIISTGNSINVKIASIGNSYIMNNLGVGTSGPAARLHAVSDTSQTALRVDSSSTGNALEIRNTGIGNCLLIEDSTSPDATPTRIDSTGQIWTNSEIRFDASLRGLVGYGSGADSSMIVDMDCQNCAADADMTYRFFRGTNTTGSAYVAIHSGNGTAGTNHVLGANGDSYLCNVEGNIVVGGNSADASAKLQVDSITAGLLPPRMTTTQQDAISSPATGLQIFNTTDAMPSFYDGTSWRQTTYKKYVSSDTAPSTGSPFVHQWIHGLGSAPDLAYVKITCTSTDAGYTVGDEIILQTNCDGDGARNFTVKATATTIVIYSISWATIYLTIVGDEVNVSPLDATKWKMNAYGIIF